MVHDSKVHDSKVLAFLQDSEKGSYIDGFIEMLADALELLYALQEALDSDKPNARRCMAYLRTATASMTALDELRMISDHLDRLLSQEVD